MDTTARPKQVIYWYKFVTRGGGGGGELLQFCFYITLQGFLGRGKNFRNYQLLYIFHPFKIGFFTSFTTVLDTKSLCMNFNPPPLLPNSFNIAIFISWKEVALIKIHTHSLT
jgi:hypothetical protein